MSQISRRSLLGAGVAGAVTVASAPPTSAATPRWPGHKPGKCYLGFATRSPLQRELDRVGSIGVRRHFYQWSIGPYEKRRIADDHAARRIPWVSFQPPSGNASTWRAIGNGQYDAEIRRRARAYAEFNKPIIVTFHHEPTEEGRSGDLPLQFRRAWCRVHDVMKDETNLRNVVSVPIIGEFTFNPWNRKDDPDDWVRPDVLSRCHFFGTDLYQNPSGEGLGVRLERIRDHLRNMGYGQKMIGIGEIGATGRWGPSAETWWRRQWNWVSNNTDKVGVISYYHNPAGTPSKPTWRLDQTSGLLDAFRRSVRSSVASARL